MSDPIRISMPWSIGLGLVGCALLVWGFWPQIASLVARWKR